MSYSSFTNFDLKEKFGVTQEYRSGIFEQIAPRAASETLQRILAEDVPFALAQGTEKARSEFIIAPILSELRRQTRPEISIFSGVEFNIDIKSGLIGFCDFLISRSAYQSLVEAPIVVAVEAKRQDFERGTTQCIAEMIAARIFNERRNVEISEIYGCVTTGDVWRFLVLRGSEALIETTTFDVRADLEQILGILAACALGDAALQQ